ncbi:unnamed protein product [Caenorhabditis bovis]|uniref:Uncharacterized protein n=1 Tax=Caenorhabditis bovis TaxID=2654633 RepID=A0A8S1F9E6_9PELO|nr:unnamed protein product [Caenorhabditis bovis]
MNSLKHITWYNDRFDFIVENMHYAPEGSGRIKHALITLSVSFIPNVSVDRLMHSRVIDMIVDKGLPNEEFDELSIKCLSNIVERILDAKIEKKSMEFKIRIHKMFSHLMRLSWDPDRKSFANFAERHSIIVRGYEEFFNIDTSKKMKGFDIVKMREELRMTALAHANKGKEAKEKRIGEERRAAEREAERKKAEEKKPESNHAANSPASTSQPSRSQASAARPADSSFQPPVFTGDILSFLMQTRDAMMANLNMKSE